MKAKSILLVVFLIGFVLLSTACFSKPPTPPSVSYADITVEAKYAGEVEEAKLTVPFNEECTVKALEVPDYTFWYWECNGEKVSEDAEYTFPAAYDATYYAIYKPNADDTVLINAVCEKDAFADFHYPDIGINVGGYVKKGEKYTVRSTGDLAVSYFRIDDTRTEGPSLDLTADDNITLYAEFEENVCEVIIEDECEHCGIEMTEGSSLIRYNGKREYVKFVAKDVEEGYLPKTWVLSTTETPTGGTVALKEIEYSYSSSPEFGIDTYLLVNLKISLKCTCENIIPTYPVEIVSSDGSGANVVSPDYFIGEEQEHYTLTITPNEDSYIKEVNVINCDQPEFTSLYKFDGFFNGGTWDIPYFDKNCVVNVVTVKKENAAIVTIDSLDEDFALSGSGGSAPSITTQTIVAEKGVDHYFENIYQENLLAIYEVNRQFSHISDKDGNLVSRKLNFFFNVTEDTEYFINYSYKPDKNDYFDFDYIPEEHAYAVRLNPLTAIMYPERIVEYSEILEIPSTYCGVPVTKISDYGMSYYDSNGFSDILNSAIVFKKLRVPSSIKYIGKCAFASWAETTVVFDEDIELEYISPDAFWSPNDSVSANLTKDQLLMMVKSLHEEYIGDSSEFYIAWEDDSHFNEGDLGHYTATKEFICVKESSFENVSAFELNILYHELAHHYQFVSIAGTETETFDSLKIKPTDEEVEGWSLPYDKSNPDAYLNHPMEISAREFSSKYTGYTLYE